jgi:hypothetical protein
MTIRQKMTNLCKAVISCFAMLMFAQSALAADTNGVVVPPYHDDYSAYVKRLEAGETNLNYTDFRESFLESEQFKVAGGQVTELQTLRKEMHELMRNKKYAEIIDITRKMLTIDYTDMEAHKILQQTYKILGDMQNSKKYHDTELGLLNSIIKNGDGKTCETGWPVIQINEEYFILRMLGARLERQSIDHTGGLCDKMEVQTDKGETVVYYFDISRVFEGYKRRGIQ